MWSAALPTDAELRLQPSASHIKSSPVQSSQRGVRAVAFQTGALLKLHPVL
jgi:hypothetical protein